MAKLDEPDCGFLEHNTKNMKGGISLEHYITTHNQMHEYEMHENKNCVYSSK